MTSRRRAPGRLAAVVVLGLALGACGDGDDTAGSTTTSPAGVSSTTVGAQHTSSRDATDELLARFDGPPTAGTAEALAEAIVQRLGTAGEGEGEQPTVTLDSLEGDTPTIATITLTGLADDSVEEIAYEVHLVESSGSWWVEEVQRVDLCARGVAAGGATCT